jgi:hypothetical protein
MLVLADPGGEPLDRIDSNWLIGGQDGAAKRLGLPRTTLIYKMRKLGIETRRSLGARPIPQWGDERCRAPANCFCQRRCKNAHSAG